MQVEAVTVVPFMIGRTRVFRCIRPESPSQAIGSPIRVAYQRVECEVEQAGVRHAYISQMLNREFAGNPAVNAYTYESVCSTGQQCVCLVQARRITAAGGKFS